MNEQIEQITKAAEYIRNINDKKIDIAMVLGSGLSSIADIIEVENEIKYKDIPHFHIPTAPGHGDSLVIGKFKGKRVLIFKGRVHFYEVNDMKIVTFPIRVCHKLGIDKLFLTNACGGVNEKYVPGTLMVLSDHIDLMGTSPLIGPNLEGFGTRFPDMTYTYSKRLQNLALSFQEEINVPIENGVYAGWFGPAYETPAEIRMIRAMGADAVGMSTVPEALVASHQEMEIIAISCITNMASGVLDQKLSHEEVVETANKVKSEFIKLVSLVVEQL